jgi:hypothetical protein
MELNITELNPNNIDYIQSSFEQIPENTVPIKVIKKAVRFQDPQKPIHQEIPSANAKMTRPSIVQKKPKISYEDILSKMGMFVSQGKLHLLDENHDKDQQIQYLKQTQNMQKTQIYYVTHNKQTNSYGWLPIWLPRRLPARLRCWKFCGWSSRWHS